MLCLGLVVHTIVIMCENDSSSSVMSSHRVYMYFIPMYIYSPLNLYAWENQSVPTYAHILLDNGDISSRQINETLFVR